MRLPLVYIDIDGTLTESPRKHDGTPKLQALARVRECIASGHKVVIWSGGGAAYARRFCKKHDLHPAMCLGKPQVIVDDKAMDLLGGPYMQKLDAETFAANGIPPERWPRK
jgi:hydroxymethylpyrimidine pyrophosphatase-like HAD family hydrolase